MSVDPLNVGKIGNVMEGLGRKNGRYTNNPQPRSGSHGKFGYGITELLSEGWEIGRIRCDEM